MLEIKKDMVDSTTNCDSIDIDSARLKNHIWKW